uniref:Uncharacterized protein n=1 Tax=Zea mays TaxID=4577 RepID=A0A804UB17_MAIZE
MPPPYKMRVIYRPGRHQTGSQEAHTSLIENLLHSTPRKQATTTSGNDEAEAGELYYTCHPTSQPAKPSYHGEDGGEQQQRRRRRRQEEDVQGRADAELGLVGVGGASARPEDADMARLPRHRRGRGARARRRAALPPGLGGRPQLPAPPPVRPAPRGHHVAQSHPARGRRRRQRLLLLLLRRWRRLARAAALRATRREQRHQCLQRRRRRRHPGVEHHQLAHQPRRRRLLPGLHRQQRRRRRLLHLARGHRRLLPVAQVRGGLRPHGPLQRLLRAGLDGGRRRRRLLLGLGGGRRRHCALELLRYTGLLKCGRQGKRKRFESVTDYSRRSIK